MTSTEPHRLQRRVGEPFPPGAVFVGKGSRWENPFLDPDYPVPLTRSQRNDLFVVMCTGCWSPNMVSNLDDAQYAIVYETRNAWTKRIGGHPAEVLRQELRGHDLLCWCPEGAPSCHADHLLRRANA